MKESIIRFGKIRRLFISVFALCLICILGIGVQGAESKAAVTMKEPKMISVNAPENVTTALRVTWQPVENADGYIIYRKTENSTAWERIKKVAGQSKSYYSNIYLEPGTKYTYTVQSFCQINGKVYYSSKGTSPISAVTHLKTPTLKSATSVSYNQIKVVWTAVTNAQGYRIYRKEAGTGWKLIRRIAGENKYYCIDSTAETGKQYYYTVRETCSVDGKLYLSGYNTKGIVGKAMLGTSAITSIKMNNGEAVLTWKQIPGAQGYVVMRSTAANGTYTKVRTAQGIYDTSWTDKNMVGGTTYYYKVRAFKQVEGKFVYGQFSTVKSASKQLVEIMDYISMKYDSQTIINDLNRLASAIGDMSKGYYGHIYQLDGQKILIHQTDTPAADEVNLIIQNGGNEGVTLHGIRIGDTYATIKTKLLAYGYKELGATGGVFNYAFLYRDGTAAIGVKIVGGRMTAYKMSQLDPSIYYSSISSISSPMEIWKKLMGE